MPDMKIERNARVLTKDGELGRVSHLVVDRRTKEVTDIVVECDGREQMIPVSQVASVSGDEVTLTGGNRDFQKTAFDRED